ATTAAVDDGSDGDTGDGTSPTTAGDSTTTTAPAETTTTAPAETTTTIASGNGWVDTGNGVLVPPVLLAIRWCESTDNYQAANPSSSARGAYQFLSGSWRAYGHADRYGVSTADQARRAQQDEAALLTWERDGTRPWNASRHCWSGRI
ncbi:MAG: transglycosylase family protein, partial [Acidimicrobiales bacterium]